MKYPIRARLAAALLSLLAAASARAATPAASADCFYCTRDERLTSRMIEICALRSSTVYLLRNQYFPGRCVVAYDEHRTELFQLSEAQRAQFMDDVAAVARAIEDEFHPDKVNYAIFGDEVSHLHFHVVPKYKSTPAWGKTFADLEDAAPVKLTEAEYGRRVAALRARLVGTVRPAPPARGAESTAALKELRIGIIGLDTTHAVGFVKDCNDPANPHRLPGARVVAAFKGGSPDVKASISRVDGFTAEITGKYGVKLYPTVEDVARNCDALLILSDDGRAHLDEARRIFPFHKPVYIDKPMTASLRDAVEIFRLARQYDVPCFSSSGLRFTSGMTAIRQQSVGKVLGVVAYSPAELEPHHPDLYWYGIHAVEAMYTIMGTGCVSVQRTHTDDTDVVTGVWRDGRVATVRGTRNAEHRYGLVVFGSKGVAVDLPAAKGALPRPPGGPDDSLAAQILRFFRTGVEPVPRAETIEILTFMSAADVSRARGGAAVRLDEVLAANGGAAGIERGSGRSPAGN